MIYWYNRLQNNQQEQARVTTNLIEYLGDTVPNAISLTQTLVSTPELVEAAKTFVETLMVPTKTVDLVITKPNSGDKRDKEVLCMERGYYPFGLALPGGIIKDSDEDNSLNLPADVFAALRVAGEKVLGLGDRAQYTLGTDAEGKSCYIVHGEQDSPSLRLYTQDAGGYHYRENIKSILRPSDPRHIVDTVGFRCELDGDVNGKLSWRNKSIIMDPREPVGGFAFGHHRELVAHITSQTSVSKERQQSEREFIRGLMQHPLESYQQLKDRFARSETPAEAPFPELFPVVDKLFTDAFSQEINQMCEQNPLLAGIRDKTIISLRQVSLKNRTFCPYLPTLLAIADGVAFFDLVARQKRGFYDTMPKDKVVEHDPSKTPYASYHMYRYKYRFDQLLSMIPGEIIIPTFESVSATDLMKLRGVPIRLLGLAEDFLYVDEFDQSPEEFFMHDANHSYRMIQEDKAAILARIPADKIVDGRPDPQAWEEAQQQFLAESNEFLMQYLDHIKIRKTDTEEEREMKKLKKIILFEVVHEDARPFLKEIICKYIQQKEGAAVPFEVPRIDQETGYMDIVDTLDTGISTLSYVRNKLQHGFYDHIDAQLPQIVDPRYRTASWIAKAAYEMLVELGVTPEQDAELDGEGHVAYEWLLRRTASVGPDNIHGEDVVDPDVEEFGDGAQRLNPKRYQVGTE
jgi:hypothetical protein